MPSKKTIAQASLEYLITYGWALVMIATIIGILVFTAGGGINTNTCTTFLGLICKGIGADGDTLILVLQNSTAQKITINPFVDIQFGDKQGYAKIVYGGTEYRFEDVDIASGDEFTIKGVGMVLEDQLTITYYEHATGLTRTYTSNMSTDAPDDIELSNDGLPNTVTGLADCQNPDVGECYYVIDIPPKVADPPSGGFQTIPLQFDTPNPIAAGMDIISATSAIYVESITSHPSNISGNFDISFAEPNPDFDPSPQDIKLGWNFRSAELLSLSGDTIWATTTATWILTAGEIELSPTEGPKLILVAEPVP